MPNNKENKNIDFKIIAIRPLSGCNKEILKVLEPGCIYSFYNDYAILDDDTIVHTPKYPANLYDYRRLKINLSAIAGKNGTGKSSITDLLLMAINNIALHFDVKDDLEAVKGLKVELYVHLKEYHKITVIGETVVIRNYNSNKLILGNAGINDKMKLTDLFYTIGMNYSHYAYNTADYTNEEQEDWLSALFHKNDAYQTPLVINPWRENGNINIDRENGLVQSRLIANLLRPSNNETFDFRNITENLRAVELILTDNGKKIRGGELYKKKVKQEDGTEKTIKYCYDDLVNLKKSTILSKINKAYNFGYDKYKIKADDHETLAMDYLIRKLITISIKYDEYKSNYLEDIDDFDYAKLSKYIGTVIKDRSHIVFKFRQTLNFLRHKHIKLDKGELQLTKLSQTIQETIAKKQTHKDKIIELIPPPIFSVDVLLAPIKGPEKEIFFKLLSSGEKQMIYSVSSILYHLANLDSVRVSTEKKIKYRVVQLILEEIELYFHPEMQRNYIKFLRDSIIQLELVNIRNISVCFVTHSPFILSDIPNSNILSLEVKDGQAIQVNKSRKTFAANIHDLLADSFFMQDGFCGAYAIDCINNTITFLNEAKRIKNLKFELQEDPDNEELMDEINFWEDNLNQETVTCHELLIKNIAEPVIAIKLSEMFDEVFPKNREDDIRAQIAKLQQLLEN